MDSISGGVKLTTGEELPDALVLWNAGVKVEIPRINGSVEGDRKGRISVDETLRATDGCYVAGDAALFTRRDSQEPLFMASYFAAQEGKAVTRNVIREINGEEPEPYSPRDYGFVVPLANGRGCGTILGRNLRGSVPVLVHHGAGWKRARSTATRRARLKAVLTEGMGI